MAVLTAGSSSGDMECLQGWVGRFWTLILWLFMNDFDFKVYQLHRLQMLHEECAPLYPIPPCLTLAGDLQEGGVGMS